MREKGLAYANAVELNKVKNDEDRRMLLERAVKERPSKNEVILWIKSLKADETKISTQPDIVEIAKRVNKLVSAKKITKLTKANQDKLLEYFSKISEILDTK
jgi:ParB family chromosome partitioning protein